MLIRLLTVALVLSAGIAQAAGGADADSVRALADVTVTSSATVVRAGVMDRVTLSCTNTSAVAVRWGDSTVTATKGQRIAGGATVEIRNRDAVYMISEGANVTMSCTEELR